MFEDLRRLVPDQIRRSYAAKFGIVLLVLGLSVGVIGGAATLQIQNEVQDGVNSEYANLAESESNTIEQWARQNTLSTRLTSEQSIFRGNPTQDYSPMLTTLKTKRDQLRRTSGDVFHIHLANSTTGEAIASTSPQVSRRDDLSTRAWFSSESMEFADANSVHISDVYSITDNDGDNRNLIAFSSPVGFDAGRVVVVTVDVSQVATTFQGGARADGGFTQIVGGDGTIIFDERNSEVGTTYPQEAIEPVEQASQLRGSETASAGVVSMSANDAVIENDEYADDQYIVGYAPVDVEDKDWVAVVHAPRGEAYGFVTTVSNFGFTATLLGVIIVGVVGAILGRNTARSIDRLTAKTQQMEEGDLSVDFSTDRIDNIGRLYEAFGSMRTALRNQIQEAQEARQEAENARERAEMMNRHLVEKADEYSSVMRACAQGDLTQRMNPESRNEAMEEIAAEFNEMMAEIEATTEQVKDFATEVATSTEEVTASSEEVKGASEQVTESIQEISDGSERQNQSLQSVSEEMSGLSTTIEEIASSANEVAELSERTAETGDEARGAAEDAIAEMNEVEAEANQTVEEIERLQSQMEEIEEITEFIADVAEQTNILALNANIEAARAGEAGEGFAVVADEVKSLAEDTRESAEEIDDLIEGIQEQTELTAAEVKETSKEVAKSTESVANTVEALEQIAGFAQETNTGVQEISAATTEQASSTNQVVGMVDEAATIAEQTSAESENVAAAAEEQTTALTEVTQSASDLAQQASKLSAALDRFNTAAGTEPGEILEGSGDHEEYRPIEEPEPAADRTTAPQPTADQPADEERAGERDVEPVGEGLAGLGGEADEAGGEATSGMSPAEQMLQGDEDEEEAATDDGTTDDLMADVLGGEDADDAVSAEPDPVQEAIDALGDAGDAGADAGEGDSPDEEDATAPEADDGGLDADDRGSESDDGGPEVDEVDGGPDADGDDGADGGADTDGEADEPDPGADGDGAIDEWLVAQRETVDEMPDPAEIDEEAED